MLKIRIILKGSVRRLNTQWYYATDIPCTKPYDPDYEPPSGPQKFEKLSKQDSCALEKRYRVRLSKMTSNGENRSATIQVGEDNLYTINLDTFTIKPTYWHGPTYEVRRGLWFNSNGTPLAPHLCSELETLSDNKVEVQKLQGTYNEGKYVLFSDENSNAGFILKNLDGGKLFLNYLKSGLGSYIPINGVAVYKGEKKPIGFKNIDKMLVTSLGTDNSMSSHDNRHLDEKPKEQPSVLSNLTSWDLFENMPAIFSTTGSDKNPDNPNIDEDYMNQVQLNGNPTNTKRKIRDLVLCVHGIGQTLGKKYEYVNFAHTVNLLRSNIKTLYSESDQLKELNREKGNSDWETNPGIQVLPITWRHSIKFKTDPTEDDICNPEIPALADITVSGILPLRKLMGDVALDVLLYGEEYYKKIILDTVMKELNDTYTLFMKKNPDFNGRVHLIGHSLGSLILFDMISQHRHYKLKFNVSHFFGIGSPVGLIKLVERTRIGPKKGPKPKSTLKVNRPNCEEFYNLYHTCDPVAYRVEPLIDTKLSQFEQSYLPHWSELDGFTTKMIEMSGNLWDGLPAGKQLPGMIENSENDSETEELPKKNDEMRVTGELLNILTSLNHSGRVDYALKPNLLEVDVISALKSHVSYFEETDIAGFVMMELLKEHQRAEEIVAKKI
ncbi:similar to Saccharomyces cerevisiae YOR022C Protein with similarity to bovine phospholipase A1 [Maudiozyma barnettii]|uniref:Similar to Saccharomyces cerevisiae YOR022C Protein with similarity to bovine phospholipase A1 n=1 Tax=Maudiozyma barnettii TaxID=61262 RepID=A0A8H2VJ13_9SACH|nr:putative carboxylic ester hydrolase [Kazachstania barnettii]CAB4256311.1 similar to Saccharomyces cerevisiae YOR022C Protein with similarity to bovine phospholipase A1 [Kazachstania barnettii]CAD1784920.1 similar to Saccharomyces cerevisiae YOR022C Protein with similarity to bovine phospholipase A1 [Kazachstania barnettii]